ncbi:MAG: ribulose-phosphate 3-epimerase [Mycoplasma sp.]|nr:ribulose-phosphate 3-epimerase [Mycoplasma sp.]
MNKKIAVSLLNVENSKRGILTNTLLKNGVNWVHYDIMDGVFVPNLAISLEEVKENISKTNKHFVDIHLMVSSPERYIEMFKKIADLCTFHYETDFYEEIEEILSRYQNSTFKLGLAIKPKTNIEQIYGLLKYLDVVLIMSVEPGKGGQKFQESSLLKINKLRNYIDRRNIDTLIEVDGGITDVTGPKCIKAGADILVSGSYLCNNTNKEKIKILKKKGLSY